MNLQKEDFETLKTVEDKLYTACYCKFVRISSRADLETIDRIYKKVFNTTKGLIGGCQHCIYEGCAKLGKLYFADKKAYEAEEAKKAENPEPKPNQMDMVDEHCGSTVTKTEKKPAAKKKKAAPKNKKK